MNLSIVRELLRRTFRLSTTPYLEVTPKSENKECKDKVLVVGLGNYCAPRSRHSVGQSLIEHVAERNNCQFEYKRQVKGHLASFIHNEFEVYLLKPKVFMNLSGKSVIKATRLLKIEPANILLLHDELDLPLGKFRVKSGGSANGHNGVRDSQERLKFTDLKRIRIGIGRPANKDDVADYVLEDFTKPEKLLLRAMYGDLSELLLSTVNLIVNPQDAQQQPKKKNKQPKKKKVKIVEPGSELKSGQIVSNGSTSPECSAEPAVDLKSELNTDLGVEPTPPESTADGSETDIAETTPDLVATEELAIISPELTDVILESEEVKISELVQKDLQLAESALFTETEAAAEEIVADPETKTEPQDSVPSKEPPFKTET